MTKDTKNELRLLLLRLESDLRDPVDLAKTASTVGAMWQIVNEELALVGGTPFQVV